MGRYWELSTICVVLDADNQPPFRRCRFNPWSRKIPMPWSNWAYGPQLLSLCPATREATTMRSLPSATRGEPPFSTTQEKVCAVMKTRHSQKIQKRLHLRPGLRGSPSKWDEIFRSGGPRNRALKRHAEAAPGQGRKEGERRLSPRHETFMDLSPFLT